MPGQRRRLRSRSGGRRAAKAPRRRPPAQPEPSWANALGLPHVDVGHGWLIFALPPAEVAVHPSDTNGRHELYLMTENLEVFVAAMGARGVGCTPPQDQGWGVLTSVTLPGGGTLGVYEPRHARPEWRAR